MDKNLKKILVILLILLVILFLISNMLFNKPSSEDKENSYIDEKYENTEEKDTETHKEYKYEPQIQTKYSDSMFESEKKEASSVVDEVLGLINEKDFKTLYEKLDSESKLHLYNDFESFEKEMLKKTSDYTYACDGYIAEYYGYDCVFYPANVYEDVDEKTLEFIIKVNTVNKDYSIILDRILDVKQRNMTKYIGDLMVMLEKEIQHVEDTTYKVIFKNNFSSTINIDFNEVYATEIVNGYEYNTYLDKQGAIQLKPGENRIVELKFYEYPAKSEEPYYLNINVKIKNQDWICSYAIYDQNQIDISGVY